ncbi:hypothetical protein B0T10DRAFT_590929 [Thelonectria olida]|uniref:MACPF-like domain-containing protein n=1 Tax=Thelonectria olida TaxID=1576542 RepID=A0A9P8VRM4_9HYPO|nr:hypothetical protein B0T10DRAFT_590929 [Thelonectria olida]
MSSKEEEGPLHLAESDAPRARSSAKVFAASGTASRFASGHSKVSSSSALSNAKSKAEDQEEELEAEEQERKAEAEEQKKKAETEEQAKKTEAENEEKKPGVETTEPEVPSLHSGSQQLHGSAPRPESHKDAATEGLDSGNENDDKNTDAKDDGNKGGDVDNKDVDATDNDKKDDDADAKTKADTDPSDNVENKDAKTGDNDPDGGNPKPKKLRYKKKLGVDDFLNAPPKKARRWREKQRNWEADPDDYTVQKGLSWYDKQASQLGEDEWEEVLENCGAMYGWCIDRTSKRIVRAPKPAFQLKTIPPPANAPATASAASTDDESDGDDSGSDTESSNKAAGQSSTAPSSPTSPTTPTTSSSSNATPSTTNSSGSVSVDALGSSITVSVSGKDAHVSIVPASAQTSSQSGNGNAGTTSAAASNASGSDTEDSSGDEQQPPQPTKMLPSFSVNDNSNIDVIVSSHEFQTSMATNDFSASSTEASLSGSYGPISASVSYSHDSTSSSSASNTSDQYHKTMIAKYSFPRVDLFLDSSCLEPTLELQQAITKVQTSKNIKDLRQLRRDFGYLFCKQLTLGGRLQTLQLMDQSLKTSEQEQKQSLKTSVGLAISSPQASASASHTQESGSANSSSQTQSDKSEQHAFDAMGGDTLLASNPTAWVHTVGRYRNWRVINRDALILMSDAISDMAGFEHTRSWFSQAVPALSKYIEFTDNPTKKIRLRLMSPNHHLCLSYKMNSQDPDYALPPNYYFGHRPLSTVMPIALDKQDSQVWGSLILPGPRPEFLFSPGSYRAPAIYGYAANKVGQSLYGTTYDAEFMSTVWSITSPFDDALCHGSRVTIQSNSVRTGPSPVNAQSAPAAQNELSISSSIPLVSSLVVFRNQQGVFLPGMSDSKDVHIWRILKKGAPPESKANISEGDEILLSWCFQDQYCGYRDFTEDVFGRRRTSAPPETKSSVLYMKLPWPRFEPVESLPDQQDPLPNSLMMSEVSLPPDNPNFVTQDQIRVIAGDKDQMKDILVEDCIFRLDLVKNHGRGDVDDYLLQGVSQVAIFASTIANEEKAKLERIQQEQRERDEEMRQREEDKEREAHETDFATGVSDAVGGFLSFF